MFVHGILNKYQNESSNVQRIGEGFPLMRIDMMRRRISCIYWLANPWHLEMILLLCELHIVFHLFQRRLVNRAVVEERFYSKIIGQ